MPQDHDSKVLEFEYAKNGMIGLETCYLVLKTTMPEIKEEKWVELLTVNPRKIFDLPYPVIDVNRSACLSLFNPSEKTKIENGFFYSRSANTPFNGMQLSGAVKGTVLNDKLFLRK